MKRTRRSGAALLLALIAVTTISGTALRARMNARVYVRAYENRASEARIEFFNSGCLVRRLAELQRALSAAGSGRSADSIWTGFDAVPSILDGNCHICISPAGRTVDANTPDTLLLAAAASLLEPARRREIVDRILDWRDADDERRDYGAERDDYPDSSAHPPANRFFISNEEVAAAVGNEDRSRVLTYVAVQNAPFWTRRDQLTRTTMAVPGVTDTTSMPTAWFMSSYASVSQSRSVSGTRWRLGRSGSALVVLEQSSRPISPKLPTGASDCQ